MAVEPGSLESSRPKRVHLLGDGDRGVWRYTACGHLLPAGMVVGDDNDQGRVTCGNCRRTRLFATRTAVSG